MISHHTQSIDEDTRKSLKTDRRYLEAALREAARLLNRSVALTGDACRCPFHDDKKPSGSLHTDNTGRDWLYTCHVCQGGNSGWNSTSGNGNGNVSSGDAMAVLMEATEQAGKPLNFQAACQWLLNNGQNGQQAPSRPIVAVPPVPPPPVDPNAAARAARDTAERADAAHNDLLGDSRLLDQLWAERAIDADTVRASGMGHRFDDRGRAWWCFPIDNGHGPPQAIKQHAADGQQPKCNWYPPGAKHGNPLFPVMTQRDGPVWLCPGELKALAVASLKLPAVGTTSGEKNKPLPAEAIKLLTGRQVAIAPDNDETGKDWAATVNKQLVDAGVDARIVDLGLTTAGSDIGDWIVGKRVRGQLPASQVAQQLQQAFSKATAPTMPTTAALPEPKLLPPPTTQQPSSCSSPPANGLAAGIRSLGSVWTDMNTWKPVKRISTGISELDRLLNGGFVTGQVHLLSGRPGAGKTQLATQIAVNAALAGQRVGFLSLEMDRHQLGRLMLSQLSGVPRSIIDGGLRNFHAKHVKSNVQQTMAAYHALPIDIVDGPAEINGVSREMLRDLIRAGRKTFGWDIVIVDHFGEIAPLLSDRSQDGLRMDRENIAALRLAAIEHGVPVLVVMPVRKIGSGKKSSSATAELDDVLGSTSIGYAAASCMSVHGEFNDDGPSTMRVKLNKHRFGPNYPTAIELAWSSHCGRVSDKPSIQAA